MIKTYTIIEASMAIPNVANPNSPDGLWHAGQIVDVETDDNSTVDVRLAQPVISEDSAELAEKSDIPATKRTPSEKPAEPVAETEAPKPVPTPVEGTPTEPLAEET
jgi:hypothetical protein